MTTAGEVGNKSEPMLGARSTSWLADWLASKNDFASSITFGDEDAGHGIMSDDDS
jgi:hypothetical protein